jgi:hypothetical protein
MPVAVYTDKSLGLFPMHGFGRTGHRQVPSAICRVLFDETLVAKNVPRELSGAERYILFAAAFIGDHTAAVRCGSHAFSCANVIFAVCGPL